MVKPLKNCEIIAIFLSSKSPIRRVSLSQLSRFERGESELSVSKFLAALENIHVEVKEFMDALSGYQHSEQIRFMSQLIDLEYRRDIEGFRQMQTKETEKFREHPDRQRHQLNSILLQVYLQMR